MSILVLLYVCIGVSVDYCALAVDISIIASAVSIAVAIAVAWVVAAVVTWLWCGSCCCFY